MVPRRCRQPHRTGGDRYPQHRHRQRRGDGASTPAPSRIRLACHRTGRCCSDRTIHPGAGPMIRLDDQRGAVSTELAVLTPLLIGFMLLAIFAGRVAQAEGDVAHAGPRSRPSRLPHRRSRISRTKPHKRRPQPTSPKARWHAGTWTCPSTHPTSLPVARWPSPSRVRPHSPISPCSPSPPAAPSPPPPSRSSTPTGLTPGVAHE